MILRRTAKIAPLLFSRTFTNDPKACCISNSYIISYARTPYGAYLGNLEKVSAVDLGTLCLVEAIKRAKIKPEQINELIVGNVIAAGCGQSIDCQIKLKSGFYK